MAWVGWEWLHVGFTLASNKSRKLCIAVSDVALIGQRDRPQGPGVNAPWAGSGMEATSEIA